MASSSFASVSLQVTSWKYDVISVFCGVDPSEVPNQPNSFAVAFVKHESKYKDDVEGMHKVQRWRTALTQVANLEGCDILHGVESKALSELLAKYLHCVSLYYHLPEMLSGKDNNGKSHFDEVSDQFEASCFLADIKESKNRKHSSQGILIGLRTEHSKVLRVEDLEERLSTIQ
ncbi:hypothetical protein HAX54_033380 [Datura stramonium]|uniref:TIR domain-containing protein n=1 Tax=Datura stramonium TaxID=4076 RepID=A0ABS8VDB0_DATST|nr:hypothetical protein [Datura stramonium]